MNKIIKLSTSLRADGENPITHLTLRKPDTGTLRGLKMFDLMQLDVNALGTLVPRICQPSISSEEFLSLPLADSVAVGLEVIGFFGGSIQPEA